MPTLSAFDLANHWPFIRRHLALSRTPATARALDVLAAETVERRGEPVAMRRALLERPYGPPGRERPATAGQAGNAWRALDGLRRRGVVLPYEGAGRRGHLWHFLPADFGRQWREMPWVSSARRVASTVEACRCRAEFPVVARIPGQGVALSRETAGFLLGPDDHLVFRAPDARQSRQLARLVADELGIRLATARQEPGSPGPIPLPGSSFGTTSSSKDEEVLFTISATIAELTGEPPLPGLKAERILREALPFVGDVDLVVAELRRMPNPDFWKCVEKVRLVAGQLARGETPRGAAPPAAVIAERRRLEKTVEHFREQGAEDEAEFYEQQLARVGM